MITNKIIEKWQDLEDETAKILQQCGFNVEKKKTLSTVRGQYEVDVYVEELVRGRKYIILCECKHWNQRIPQEKIHAFRTVVNDIGANVGYIISSQGFQSGAYNSVKNTNIELLTFTEFQDSFKESWYINYFPKIVELKFGSFINLMEPTYKIMVVSRFINEDAILRYEQINSKNFFLLEILLACSIGRSLKLPLCDHYDSDQLTNVPQNLKECIAYLEFIYICENHLRPVIDELKQINIVNNPNLKKE